MAHRNGRIGVEAGDTSGELSMRDPSKQIHARTAYQRLRPEAATAILCMHCGLPLSALREFDLSECGPNLRDLGEGGPNVRCRHSPAAS